MLRKKKRLQCKYRSSFTCFPLRSSSPPPALPTGSTCSRQTSSLEARSFFPRSQLPSPATRVWEMRCVAALLHRTCGACLFVERGVGFCTTFTIHNCMHALARRVLVIGQEDSFTAALVGATKIHAPLFPLFTGENLYPSLTKQTNYHLSIYLALLSRKATAAGIRKLAQNILFFGATSRTSWMTSSSLPGLTV